MRDGDARDLLGEGPLHAVSVAAEEPPYYQPDHGLLPADRGIRQATLVAAVNSAGSGSATGTDSVGLNDARMQLDPCAPPNNLVDDQRGEMGKQRLQTTIVAPPT